MRITYEYRDILPFVLLMNTSFLVMSEILGVWGHWKLSHRRTWYRNQVRTSSNGTKDLDTWCKRPKVEEGQKYDDGKKQAKNYRQVTSTQKKLCWYLKWNHDKIETMYKKDIKFCRLTTKYQT